MKNLLWILIIGIAAGGGYYFYTQQNANQEAAQIEQEAQTLLEKASIQKEKQAELAKAAKKAKEEALAKAKAAADEAAKQAEMAAKEAANQVKAQVAAATTKQITAEIAAKIKELNTQAQAYLDSQKYQEAIDIAQNVLSNYDANSSQAKSILTTAKEQLAAAANQKVDAFKTAVTDQADGLKSKIGSIAE